MKEIDITDTIVNGDIDNIIQCLTQLRSVGYNRLYWDGFDSYIEVYNSHQPERLNPEGAENSACDSLNNANR